MAKRNITTILTAVLGILVGILGTTLVRNVREHNHNIRTSYRDWGKLNVILNTAGKYYVDTINFGKVTDEAVSAALRAMDPHSIYLTPENLKVSEEDLAGNFEGIGIQFNVPNDTAIVMEVIPGGPAEKIGMLAGDRLIKVDDKVIAGVRFPQDSMVRRMKGPAGTKVTVTVKRGKQSIPFEITRDKIPTHSIDAAFMIKPGVGYIRLSKFSATTCTEFLEESKRMLSEGLSSLIVDLRDNTGGYFEQALALSDMFLAQGDTIVWVEGRSYPKTTSTASGEGHLKDVSLTVLINENSASSSEIFAGAMQDNHRARIIGRRSFGKGLVQEPFYFTDGSAMRLTVARYFTPSGRCIQKPYSKDYDYDILHRYESGELFNSDSMKVEKGGIIPDVFVALDTTKAGPFYQACNQKATAMRFASDYFDKNRKTLSSIDDYAGLTAYLNAAGLESKFLNYAKTKDNLVPSPGEWEVDRLYMMSQVRALVGRYSKLGDNAFYHLYMGIDDTVKAALQ
ncbi:MAG: S41 family peptidase [Bacteroidales bacterium]|nr:S41 family peptidase [Bacteroidales bacterium]